MTRPLLTDTYFSYILLMNLAKSPKLEEHTLIMLNVRLNALNRPP